MATFILFDFANLVHRCKHVNIGGRHNDDIVGFTYHIVFNSIRQANNIFNADHVVFALEGKSWRREIYPEYKAHRRLKASQRSEKEVEEDKVFFEETNSLAKFLKEKTHCSVLNSKNAEADDYIARWIQNHPNDNHIICSSDGDYYQLLADNVKIFDAMGSKIVSTKSVTDLKGNQVYSTRTITEKTATGRSKKVEKKTEILPPVPEYELFKKIIRGDVSDNIKSAYPKVRENGSEKKPGIREAFDDRIKKGYVWNSFMLNEYQIVSDFDENDNPIMENVRVKDIYELNQKIVDLTMQPISVIEEMDEEILRETSKGRNARFLMDFGALLKEYDLEQIRKYSKQYLDILAKSYPHKRIEIYGS